MTARTATATANAFQAYRAHTRTADRIAAVDRALAGLTPTEEIRARFALGMAVAETTFATVASPPVPAQGEAR